MYCAKSYGTVLQEGNYTKWEIKTLNQTRHSGPLFSDSVYGSIYSANATNMTWNLRVNMTFFAHYNGSDSNWQPVGGFNILSYSSVVCTNLTAYNQSNIIQLSALAQINNSEIAGTTYTYWNGKSNGQGVDNSSIKMVCVINTYKYVVSSQKLYNWSTTEQNWILVEDYYMTSNSWTVTSAPPIPGFEFIFLLLALGVIMALFYWRKNKSIKEKHFQIKKLN
ncbi:MAG: hypothetical protein EAX96_00580 [Candidatus Lokiarchaeota archaeon]|nr:hypothetical protein [Candidatus Lokiarchaeota archaeon]